MAEGRDRYERAKDLADHASDLILAQAHQDGLPLLAVAVVGIFGEPLGDTSQGPTDVYVDSSHAFVSTCVDGLAETFGGVLEKALKADSGACLRAAARKARK